MRSKYMSRYKISIIFDLKESLRFNRVTKGQRKILDKIIKSKIEDILEQKIYNTEFQYEDLRDWYL